MRDSMSEVIHRPFKGEEGLGTRLGDTLSINGANNITAHLTRTELASLAQSLYKIIGCLHFRGIKMNMLTTLHYL